MALEKRREKERMIIFTILIVAALALLFFVVAHAAGTDLSDAQTKIQTIVQKMVDVIGMIFTAVGVILAVYAVGTLILAFKNEDADSKSRASTLLVVSVVLIAFPAVIKSIGLVEMITGK